MKIGEFLKEENMKQGDLSARMGVPQGTLSAIQSRKKHASWRTLRRLFIATRGKVTPNDVYELDEWLAEISESA